MTGSRLRPAFIVGLFLGLLTVSLQGVQGEEGLEVPPEDLCRPYIEKALKDLGTGSLEQTSTEVGADVDKESHEDEPPAASEEAGESAGDGSAEDQGMEEEKQESVEAEGGEPAGSAGESQEETGPESAEADQSAEGVGETSAEAAEEESAEPAGEESAEAAEEQSAEAAEGKSAEAAEEQSAEADGEKSEEVVAEESAEGANDQSADGAAEKSAEVVKPKEGFLQKVWNILTSKTGPKPGAVPAPAKESEEQDDKSAEAAGEPDKDESGEQGKADGEGSEQADDDASEKSVEEVQVDEGKSDEETADEQSDEEAKTIEEKSDEESQIEEADGEATDETAEEESTGSQAAEEEASEEEAEQVEEAASKEEQASAEASGEQEGEAEEASKQEEEQSQEATEVSTEADEAESVEQEGDTSAEVEAEGEQKESEEVEGASAEVVESEDKSAEEEAAASEEAEAQSPEAEDDGKSPEEEAEGKSAEEEGEDKSAEDDTDAKSAEDETAPKSDEQDVKSDEEETKASGEEEAKSGEEEPKSEEEEAKSGEEEAKSEEKEAKSKEVETAPSAEEGEELKSAEEEVKSGEEEGKSAEEGTSAEKEAEESGADEPSAEEPVEAVKSRARREVGSEEVKDVAGEAAEDSEEEAVPSDEEPTPEEDLIQDIVIPDNLRSRDHINQLLRLDEENEGKEKAVEKIGDIVLRDLKKLYDNAIQPLESLYKYRDLSNRHFGDPEIFSKPLVLFMGPWSGGKSSIINYLLDIEYKPTSLRTGAEPSPAYFNILMYGEEEEILDGTQLAADWTFSGLQKFGQGMLDRLRGMRLNNKLLEKVNIVEIPGILEIRKQVQRLFPFNDACQWFIDRADIIFLVYDPSKLDVGPETEAILDQLKGRETQTRIILNKADQVKPEELMRVQGALIWNISPLMSSAEPPIMYSTSLWSLPYEAGAPTRLLYAQERAFLRDLRTAVDKRVEHKIASARRFAVRVRNHAKMVDCYLTTYYNHKTFFGNKKEISDKIIENPQDYHIYEGLSTLTNISRYDLPDPDVYRDFFRLNALYDFQPLSSTCTYFRGCPINRLDVAIAYDLPELVGKYRKQVEQVIHEYETSSPPS